MSTTGPKIPQDALLQRLEQEAAAASTPRRAAVMLHEAGRLCEEHKGQLDRAQEWYQQSFAQDPALLINLRALSRLLARGGRFAALVPVLDAELDCAPGAPQGAAILVERARVQGEELGDLEQAHQDLERALVLAPGDPVALAAMIHLCRRLERYEQLEGLLRAQAEACDDASLASRLLLEAADLRRDQLADPDGAATLYRATMEADPCNREALEALLVQARARHDHQATAELCQNLARLTAGVEAVRLLREAAGLLRADASGHQQAIQCLTLALDDAPDELHRALLVESALVAESHQDWAAAAHALERAALAQGTPRDGADLAWRVACLRWHRLDDSQGAAAALKQALELEPEHGPAFELLVTLLRHEGRHQPLAELLSWGLELADEPPRRAWLALQLGELHRWQTGDLQEAAQAYEQALESQPELGQALVGLTAVHAELGQPQQQARALERRLALADDGEQRVWLLEQLAALAEHPLQDLDAAADANLRLLAAEPTHRGALRAARRLLETTERWDELAALLRDASARVSEPRELTAVLLDLARVLLQLEDQQAALECYQRALELSPGHQPALAGAGRLLRQAGRLEDLLALHQQELQQTTPEPAHRSWLLLKMARLLGDGLGRWEEAAAACQQALDLDLQGSGDDLHLRGERLPVTLAEMLHILLCQGDAPAAREVMRTMPAPQAPQARALHHLRLADLCRRCDDQDGELEHLRLATQATSDDDAAEQRLARIHRQAEDHRLLLNVYQSRAARTADPAEQAALLRGMAWLWAQELDDQPRAVEVMERILEAEPDDLAARQLLLLLLARLQRWPTLAAQLQQVDASPGDDPDGFGVGCVMAAAGILEHQLDDLPGAAHCAFSVLAQQPEHPEALDQLDRHYRHAADLERLVPVLGRQLSVAQSTLEQAAALASLGAACANLGQLEQALVHYRQAAQGKTTSLPAARGWAQVARQLGDPAELAQALAAEAGASRDLDHRARCTFEAAQIWHRERDRQDSAVAAYRQVLRLDPGHSEALSALSTLHDARGEWEDKVALLEQSLRDAATPQQQRELLLQMADIQRARIKNPAAAQATIGRALELFPADRQLLTTLAELCRACADWAGLVAADRRLVEQTSDTVLLNALHFELGRILHEKLDRPREAIAEFQRVLTLSPDDLAALTHLAQLYEELPDWGLAALTIEALVQLDDDHQRRKAYHLRLTRIQRDGLGDAQHAAQACQRALAQDPGDLDAARIMTELLQQAGDRQGLEGHVAASVAVHRSRLERDPFLEPSYRALRHCFSWISDQAGTRAVDAVMDVLGLASAPYAGTPVTTNRARPLGASMLEHELLHPQERGHLFQLLDASRDALAEVFEAQPRPGVGSAQPATTQQHPELLELLTQSRAALGLADVDALICDEQPEQVRVLRCSPPALLVGRSVLTRPSGEVAFLVGRGLACVRLGHHLHQHLEPTDLGQLVAAILWAACRSYKPPSPSRQLEQLRARLDHALGQHALRALASPGLELSDRPLTPERWRAAMEHSEDRVALALCADPGAALRCVMQQEPMSGTGRRPSLEQLQRGAGPRTRHLLGFSVGRTLIELWR